MKYRTRFYERLVKAKDDEVALILVIEKIMPLIDKYSLNEEQEIDEDLKSTLVEYVITLIKNDSFADMLAEE